jgi:peptide/nickel transport system substrate-binding protein
MRRRTRSWLSVIAALGLLGAACGGDDGGAADGAGGPTTTAAAGATTTLPSEVDLAGDPDPDGILVWGANFANFLSQDELLPWKSGNQCEFMMLDYIYSTLVDFDQDNVPQPALAESWQVTSSETIEFLLRDGIVFSDGTPVTATDVAETVELIKGGFPAENTIVLAQRIAAIEAVDDRTVRITTNGPWANAMISVMAGVSGMPVAPSTRAGQTQYPVGAGPMKVEALVPGQELRLVRNDEFHSPYQLGGITFVDVDLGPASKTALETGEVHLASLDGETANTFQGTDFTILRTPPTAGLVYQLALTLRRSTAPFDDVRVRQALNHAIDKESVLVAAGGVGQISGQYFPEASPWAIDELADRYPYDPDRARELLAEAGVAPGTPLRIVFPGAPTNVEQRRQAEIVKENLDDIGFAVELVPAPATADIVANWYGDQNSNAFSAATPGNADPTVMLNDNFGDAFQAASTGGTHPEIQDLIARANASYDDKATYDALVREAATIAIEEALWVPILWRPRNVVFSNAVLGGEVRAAMGVCDSVGLADAFVLRR